MYWCNYICVIDQVYIKMTRYWPSFFSRFYGPRIVYFERREKEPTVFVAQIHESRLCFLCFDCLQPPFATLSPMYVRFKFVFARDQSGQSRAARVTNQNTGFASYWPRVLRYNKCIHIHKHGMFSYWKIIHWNKDITSQRAPLTQAPYSYPDINFFARGPTQLNLKKPLSWILDEIGYFNF